MKMTTNKKLVIVVGLAGNVALAAFSFAGAQTAPLSASCLGTAAQNVITWTATSTGGVPPYTYLWSGVNLSGTSSVAVATYSTTGTYQASVQAGDSTTSTVAAVCSATVSSPSATSTSTPPTPPQSHPFFREPMLQINPGGRFLARGMIVAGVGSGSFTGTVWGITYTVNAAGATEFVMREGRSVAHFDLAQLKVGDEISVSGSVGQSQPFVVNAQVIRDYSLISLRSQQELRGNNENEGAASSTENGQGNNGNGNENGHGRGASQDIQDKIQQIFERIRELQGRMSHGD